MRCLKSSTTQNLSTWVYTEQPLFSNATSLVCVSRNEMELLGLIRVSGWNCLEPKFWYIKQLLFPSFLPSFPYFIINKLSDVQVVSLITYVWSVTDYSLRQFLAMCKQQDSPTHPAMPIGIYKADPSPPLIARYMYYKCFSRFKENMYLFSSTPFSLSTFSEQNQTLRLPFKEALHFQLLCKILVIQCCPLWENRSCVLDSLHNVCFL